MEEKRRITRKQAIIRRRIFIAFLILLLVLITAIIGFIVWAVSNYSADINSGSDDITSEIQIDSETSSSTESDKTEEVKNTTDPIINGELNPDYENLMLINADNPLPENYEQTLQLVTIDEIYRNNNNVTDIEKNVYPFITAMVKKANEDGVNLKVWSPFRSYATQKILFDRQVERVGGDEAKAATVVARPGTSEHNTGLCADFNMAQDAFESTEMYTWMAENADDYGFIMRYSAEKQSITGVIHESWHWRFVGINHAKEMNRLGLCLEEYVQYLEKQGKFEGKAK